MNEKRRCDRQILAIALPAIVANVTIPLLGLLDVGIAGHLGVAKFIGAVAVGSMMFNLIYWNFGFLRMGTSGMTAQAYGRADRAAQSSVLQRAAVLGALIGLAVIALQVPLRWLALLAIGPSDDVRQLATLYFSIGVWGAPALLVMMAIKGWLLGMQDSRGPMAISIGVNVVNIAVSLVAVFVLHMGFKGIAVGTLTAEWCGLAYAMVLLRRKHPWLAAHLSFRAAVRLRGAGSFFRVNADIFVRSFLLMLVTLFFMAVGARSGDVILAVNALIMQLFTLFSYFMDGIAFAGEALVGKCVGRRDEAALRLCVRRLLLWGSVLALLFAVAYMVFPQFIFGLLTTDGTVLATALSYRWWCVAIPLTGMAAFVGDGVFIGLTRTRGMLAAVAVASAAYFALYFALPPDMGNGRLWLAFVTYLLLRGVVLAAVYAAGRCWRLAGGNR